MAFDFADIVTVAARYAVPMAHAKGLLFSFDCEVEGAPWVGDAGALQGALHRLICSVIDTLQSGFILIMAERQPSASGPPLILVNVGGVGRCDAAALADAAQRLGLSLSRPEDNPRVPEYSAQGVCPHTGGAVELHCALEDGMLITLALQAARLAHDAAPVPEAHGARAWLVNVDEVLGHSWTRRLHRLGWAVSRFESPDAACAQLAVQPQAARPALVLTLQRDGVEADCCQALAAALPPSAQLIYAVPAHSPILQEAAPVEGYEVRVYPFSPEDLAEFTRKAVVADQPSGLTLPMPLARHHVPLILIVDDQPLNLLVGRGLTEALGYRVATAGSGEEALALCRAETPNAMLLDLQMPDMSGIDTVIELRRRQTRGEVPPFPVVGLTASWCPEVKAECIAAGMDDCIPKPTDLVQLAHELRRFCTMH